MRYVEAAGLRASVIGLGTWQFGTREWGYGHEYAHEVAPRLVHAAIDLGINMIDTAEAYGPHTSEHIIGEAIAALGSDERRGLIVATKFMPVAPTEGIVERQVRGSARRLRTDSIDLLYAHWPNPFVSVRRTMQSLRPLVEQGIVERAAVSNYSLAQWQDAERALRAPVVANQVQFNLVSPGPARDLVPYAAAMDRLVVAYSPIAQGLLARVGEHEEPTGMRRFGRMFRTPPAERLLPLQVAVREIADGHDATPAQVALAWVISHPNTIAIPGARTPEQLAENAAAADLELTPDDLHRLTEASAVFG
ncbi:MAG TPA: aldo/keto reductase [Candidatus Limnocylindrales bacterium]|nr:aldo/keto reductase [Candidatus Limnocylindrales bacterium]